MEHLIKELEEKIESCRPMIKSEWQAGHKNLSVGIEVNIDKSEDAIKKRDEKAIKTQIGIMDYYLERKEVQNEPA